MHAKKKCIHISEKNVPDIRLIYTVFMQHLCNFP